MKRLELPEKEPLPDLSKIVRIILEDFNATRDDIAAYLDVTSATVTRLKRGDRHTANYVIVNGLKELALANFDIEQLEECGVI